MKLSEKLRTTGKMGENESVTYTYDEYMELYSQAASLEEKLKQIRKAVLVLTKEQP